MRNTHEIAQEVAPGAKVVYVDIDPFVAAHGSALLSNEHTRIVTADMRDPQAILDNPLTLQMIDFRSRQRSCSSASGSARLVLSISHLTAEDMFEGYELVEPGLVLVHGWRPDAGSPRAPSVFGGVGRVNNG